MNLALPKINYGRIAPLTPMEEAHRDWKLRKKDPHNDPDQWYYYLAGPMTGYPQFNFPRFLEVADRLRHEGGLNLVVPAELDDFNVFWEAMQSPDGAAEYDKDYNALLRRDANIVMADNCVGVITIEGWKTSRGALIETFLADKFDKSLDQYVEYEDTSGSMGSPGTRGWELVAFNRQDALTAHEIQAIKEAS